MHDDLTRSGRKYKSWPAGNQLLSIWEQNSSHLQDFFNAFLTKDPVK